MAQVDQTHQHFVSQILQDDHPHTPIAPGGSISATDGTTTVDPTTAIQFPAGTLTDQGGGVAGVGLLWSLLGPVDVAFDTAGFVNPADAGIVLWTIPASSLFRVILIQKTVWDPGTFYIQAGLDNGNVNNNTVGQYDSGIDNSNATAATEPMSPNTANPVPSFVLAIGDTVVSAQWEPTDIHTQGTASFYAIVATPAS